MLFSFFIYLFFIILYYLFSYLTYYLFFIFLFYFLIFLNFSTNEEKDGQIILSVERREVHSAPLSPLFSCVFPAFCIQYITDK